MARGLNLSRNLICGSTGPLYREVNKGLTLVFVAAYDSEHKNFQTEQIINILFHNFWRNLCWIGFGSYCLFAIIF